MHRFIDLIQTLQSITMFSFVVDCLIIITFDFLIANHFTETHFTSTPFSILYAIVVPRHGHVFTGLHSFTGWLSAIQIITCGFNQSESLL